MPLEHQYVWEFQADAGNSREMATTTFRTTDFHGPRKTLAKICLNQDLQYATLDDPVPNQGSIAQIKYIRFKRPDGLIEKKS